MIAVIEKHFLINLWNIKTGIKLAVITGINICIVIGQKFKQLDNEREAWCSSLRQHLYMHVLQWGKCVIIVTCGTSVGKGCFCGCGGRLELKKWFEQVKKHSFLVIFLLHFFPNFFLYSLCVKNCKTGKLWKCQLAIQLLVFLPLHVIWK